MIYRIRHITEYVYNSPVSLCYNLAHLLPRSTHHQTCQSTLIHIKPKPSYSHKRLDYFGNNTYYFVLEEPHKALSIDVVSEISTEPVFSSLNLELGMTCLEAKRMLESDQDPDVLEAREFVMDSPMIKRSDALADYAKDLFKDETPFLSAVMALTSRIFKEFKYDPQSTTIATPLNEVLEHKHGVCQDFAHLAIGCLRSLGYAARYVSGYLETLPPPGQEKLIGADASHAWFAVYSPGEGWFEFDPTNDNMPGEQHITAAWGRDFTDVSPLQGVIFDGGGTQQLSVSVDVQRIE